MNLTKDDLMQLSKERLAELLLDMDQQQVVHPINIPPIQVGTYNPPCYAPNGICTNPFHDCINCPAKNNSSGKITINTASSAEQN